MQQAMFAFEDNATTPPDPPMTAEQERRLVELMAQAINAVLQRREGEQDEPA